MPIRDRRADLIYVVIFAVFAATSLLFDVPYILGSTVVRDAVARNYAACDPLLLLLPPFLRVAVGASAFVWGPVYVWFAWAFLRGYNGIRFPAILYCGAM